MCFCLGGELGVGGMGGSSFMCTFAHKMTSAFGFAQVFTLNLNWNDQEGIIIPHVC